MHTDVSAVRIYRCCDAILRVSIDSYVKRLKQLSQTAAGVRAVDIMSLSPHICGASALDDF